MLAMGSTIYAVWCDALAGSTNLWFAQSRDGGSSWSTATNLTAALPALASGSTPSLTLFNDKLYLSFRNGDGQLAQPARRQRVRISQAMRLRQSCCRAGASCSCQRVQGRRRANPISLGPGSSWINRQML